MKKFQYQDLTIHLHPQVYEPAGDTFQLLEAITVNDGEKILELGTGCGLIALVCAKKKNRVVCSDINPHAVKLVEKNISQNKHLITGRIEVRHGDLFSVVSSEEKFDRIIFNPPYLPTSNEERLKEEKWFNIATDGGKNGLKITNAFVSEMPHYLPKTGCAYTVVSSLADENTFHRSVSNAGLKKKVILSRWYNDERVDVYKIKTRSMK